MAIAFVPSTSGTAQVPSRVASACSKIPRRAFMVKPSAKSWINRMPAVTKVRSAAHVSMSADRELSSVLEDVFSTISDSLGELVPRQHAEAILGSDKGLFNYEPLQLGGFMEGYVDQKNKLGWITKAFQTCSAESKAQAIFWTGPTTDVPHSRVSFGINPNGYFLDIDVIAKDDLMYAPNYVDAYFGQDRQDWLKQAEDHPQVLGVIYGNFGVVDSILKSPLHLSLQYGDSAESFDAMKEAIMQHVNMWLAWLSKSEELNRNKRGIMFARDANVHKLFFRLEQSRATYMFNGDKDFATKYAASLIGPGDEAYTGQHS